MGLFTEVHGTLRNVVFDITLDEGTKDLLNVGLLAGILNSTSLYKVTINGSLLLTKPMNSDSEALAVGDWQAGRTLRHRTLPSMRQSGTAGSAKLSWEEL